MSEIRIPREDVNDDRALVACWLADDGQQVEKGQAICRLETTKTVFEVCAPEGGVLRRLAQEGEELPMGSVIARVGEKVEDEAEQAAAASSESAGPKLTAQARDFIAQHGIDPAKIPQKRGIVTLDDVKALASQPRKTLVTLSQVGRVMVLGGGSVGYQAIDILLNDPDLAPVACLDDGRVGQEVFGIPVVGGLPELEQRWQAGEFDLALVAFGLAGQDLRRRCYERCRELGIPLANAVDPTVRRNRHAVLGQGNILCSFVHLGAGARLCDNVFVAAHCSIDHHCQIASHAFFGPGCLLSGQVSVGEGALFGSGVVIQPNLTIGAGCKVASGAILTRDIPARHAVKTRLQQSVSPLGS